MMGNFFEWLYFRASNFLKKLYVRYREALFVTDNQYKLRFLDFHESQTNGQLIAHLQVITKRVRAKFSLQYIASNKRLIAEIHPIDAFRIAFIANFENNGKKLNELPDFIINLKKDYPVIKQDPILHLASESFNEKENKTKFYLKPIHSTQKADFEVFSKDFVDKPELLYGLGSKTAAHIGYSVSEDLIREDEKNKSEHKLNTALNTNSTQKHTQPMKNEKNPKYYHILCMAYVGILISGISIVSRLFPFHIPHTHLVIPLCAGMIFYPLSFFIQDATTEVYGFARSRQMIWLTVFVILFYALYTQIAIHLPTGDGPAYAQDPSYTVVFGGMPRQLFSLIVAMLAGNLLNDYFLSKSKIIFAGQYLWARVLGSTMLGEAVLQIVGTLIGFSQYMNLYHELLPNMLISYSYKVMWNVALIPFIYLLTNYLKKQEGINVFDYDVNYNPFIFKIEEGKSRKR